MENSSITISIVTVVFNGEDLLEGTFQSVFNQSYPHIEYIVVDGASTDGTLALIKENEHRITRWISEKDEGLYDAMNKGIQLATGDFIWFMNCGDHIYAPDTVEKLVEAYTPKTDVLYGEVMLVDEQRAPMGTRSEITPHQLPAQLSWKSMARGMVVSHQAFLPRRRLWINYAPNNLTADIDWVINILKKSQCTTPSGLILATYLTGGLSKKRHQQSLQDRYAVLKKHFGFFPNLFNHFLIILRAMYFKIKRIGKKTYTL
ncbi:MAG: glycosyltransferase family 2 protein [Bacteroidota bacterium]